MVETGQLCKKVAGREQGRYCVVYKIEGNFAHVSGLAKYGMCKRRRCNIKHLQPTEHIIPIKGEKQDEIERSISESGIISKLSLRKDRIRSKTIFRQKKIKPKKIKKTIEKKAPEKKPTQETPKKAIKPAMQKEKAKAKKSK